MGCRKLTYDHEFLRLSQEGAREKGDGLNFLTLEKKSGGLEKSTDYAPWGDVIREEQADQLLERYRYGYQGQFSEQDEKTGWNHFEAREYDPTIGRWISGDPHMQFWSPYMGMGNSPINGIDPSGRDWFRDPETGEPVWLGPTQTFTDNAGFVWEHLSSKQDFLVVTHNRDYNDVIGAEPINSARFDVFDAGASYFYPIGTMVGNTVPAGRTTGEVSPSFQGRSFNTVAEDIYQARQQARASHPGELALIVNEGGPVNTTWYSPRPNATGVFVHWGNYVRESLVSKNGQGPQFSEGCFTIGNCQGSRSAYVDFFEQNLIGFNGDLWLRGR